MKYIIFGSGVDGQLALKFLGHEKVHSFCDNYRYGMTIDDVPVISFAEMAELCMEGSYTILVASTKYQYEMARQLEEQNITNFTTFLPSDMPCYWCNGEAIILTPRDVINTFKLDAYKRIAIYGENPVARCIEEELRKMGKDVDCVRTLQEVEEYDYEIVVLATSIHFDNIRDCIRKMDVKVVDIWDLYKQEPLFQHPELAELKDKHKGKRIFVIGNGPSLRMEDLDKLHEEGEICIAANKIFRAYDKTKFRADYLCFSDYRVINDCKEDIPSLEGKVIVADNYHLGINEYIEGVQYVHMVGEEYYPNYPRFSEDLTTGVYLGYSVTYDIALQLAAYMGAKEIYLLGIDFSFSNNVTDKNNYFIQGYYKVSEKESYKAVVFERDKIQKAYEAAERYSKENGFRIYNATRGGMLEVFERVDFESLFEK